MLHNIMKDFLGSQDGRFSEQFKAGTQADLSDYLAACIAPDMALPVGQIENKAIVSDGSNPKMKRKK